MKAELHAWQHSRNSATSRKLIEAWSLSVEIFVKGLINTKQFPPQKGKAGLQVYNGFLEHNHL